MAVIDRFKDLGWVEKVGETPVTLVGAGGIGSWTALLLARAGVPNIIVYDDDTIENHNLGGQLFRLNSVGAAKVGEVNQIVSDFTGTSISGLQYKYRDQNITPHVITALDNMEAREAVYEKWKSMDDRKLLIDGRLLAESFQIFTVTKATEGQYEKYLFDDSEVEEVDCTAKQTSHFAAMIASHIVNIFTNYMFNSIYKEGILSVPFYQEYLGAMTMLNHKL